MQFVWLVITIPFFSFQLIFRVSKCIPGILIHPRKSPPTLGLQSLDPNLPLALDTTHLWNLTWLMLITVGIDVPGNASFLVPEDQARGSVMLMIRIQTAQREQQAIVNQLQGRLSHQDPSATCNLTDTQSQLSITHQKLLLHHRPCPKLPPQTSHHEADGIMMKVN